MFGKRNNYFENLIDSASKRYDCLEEERCFNDKINKVYFFFFFNLVDNLVDNFLDNCCIKFLEQRFRIWTKKFTTRKLNILTYSP